MFDPHQSAADRHNGTTRPRVRRSDEQRPANPRLPLQSRVRRFRVLEEVRERAVARLLFAVATRPRARENYEQHRENSYRQLSLHASYNYVCKFRVYRHPD